MALTKEQAREYGIPWFSPENVESTPDPPRYYPFGILPGGITVIGDIAAPTETKKMTYTPEMPEVGDIIPFIPADEGSQLPSEPLPGGVTSITELITKETIVEQPIIYDIPGETHFQERQDISLAIDWPSQKADVSGIPGLPGFEWPDVLGPLKDIGKYAVIIGLVILGYFLLKRKK